jgi:hypothetical protein
MGSVPATSTRWRLVGAARGERVSRTSIRLRLLRSRIALGSADRESIDGNGGGEDIALGAAAASAGSSTIRRAIDRCADRRAASLSATAAASPIEPFCAAGASTSATRCHVQPTAHLLDLSFPLAAESPGHPAGRNGAFAADARTAAIACAGRSDHGECCRGSRSDGGRRGQA